MEGNQPKINKAEAENGRATNGDETSSADDNKPDELRGLSIAQLQQLVLIEQKKYFE